MIDDKADLERKIMQLRTFCKNNEAGTWDNDSKEIIEEVRKVLFQWLILDTEEGLSTA